MALSFSPSWYRLRLAGRWAEDAEERRESLRQWLDGADSPDVRAVGPLPVFRDLEPENEDRVVEVTAEQARYDELFVHGLAETVSLTRALEESSLVHGFYRGPVVEISHAVCHHPTEGLCGGAAPTYSFCAPDPGYQALVDRVLAAELPVRKAQRYLDDTEFGIGAQQAWDLDGGRGREVLLVDVEDCFDLCHRDLPGDRIDHVWPPLATAGGSGCHGTAVAGLLVGQGGKGLHGVVPDATLRLASLGCVPGADPALTGEVPVSVENALLNLRLMLTDPHLEVQLSAGSVVLVEQEFNYVTKTGCITPRLPVEADPLVRAEIGELTDLGVHVVQAAGNGDALLDDWLQAPVVPSGPDFEASASILVGAACPPSLQVREGASNRGWRVDVHSWGAEVVTTDGDQGYSEPGLCALPLSRSYFFHFGRTSAASAIVAGMVASLSAIWAHRYPEEAALSPEEMRRIVCHSSRGDLSMEIGRRANFGEALEEMARVASDLGLP